MVNSYKVPGSIVFIVSDVDNYQSLVNGAIPEAEVIVLDSTQDGVVQITKALQGRTNTLLSLSLEQSLKPLRRKIVRIQA